MYVIFMIKETRGPFSDNENETQSINCLGVFSVFNVLEVFKTCFRRRQGYVRGMILLCILTMLFNLATFGMFIIRFCPKWFTCGFPIISEASSLIYLFARLKLGWTEQDYTTWTAIGSVGTSFATFIVVTLLSYNWKVHDTLIGALGAFFGVFARITLAFANYSWEMYLGK